MCNCKFATTMCVVLAISVLCLADKIMLFQENVRVSGVTDTTTVRSLLECAIQFKVKKESVSFNFKRETNKCEMSSSSPENSTTASEGWKVYSKIDSSNYFISTDVATWEEAKVVCEKMSGILLVIDDQNEQNFVQNLTSLHHWMGLKCNAGIDCIWLDGRNVEDGFSNWAPGEPDRRDCVWIGYQENQWDDDYCGVPREYICEI